MDFLTKPMLDPWCYSGKAEWITKHYRKYLNKLVILNGDQELVVRSKKDYLIDDHPKNIKRWADAGGSFFHWTELGDLHNPDVVKERLKNLRQELIQLRTMKEIRRRRGALNKLNVDRKTIDTAVEEIVKAAQEAREDNAAAGPKKKYKHLIVASDPTGANRKLLEETPMWVFKVPEEEKHTEVMDRFFKGVYDFNANSRKGRKNPVKTVGDGIQNVPTKHFKPNKSPVLTKEAVIVLITDNKIPS